MEEHTDDNTNGELRTDAVSNVYAEALMEMAEATGEVQSITDEVEELGRLLRTEPGLRRLITTKTLSQEARRQLIDRIFKDHVSDVVYRFLQVVNEKDRLASLPAITKAFAELAAQRKGIVEADIWVPDTLPQAQVDRIAEGLAKALDAHEVVVHQYEDPSLIGGLKIRVGDKLIDASVAKQLKNLRHRLIQQGRAKARESDALREE